MVIKRAQHMYKSWCYVVVLIGKVSGNYSLGLMAGWIPRGMLLYSIKLIFGGRLLASGGS